MQSRSTAEGRGYAITVIVLVMFLLTAWMVINDRSEAASAPSPESSTTTELLTESLLLELSELSGENVFAKYAGVDGEASDESHENWIRILSMEWGVDKSTGPITGPVRRVGSPAIEDLILTFEYDKSVPKLVDRLLKGFVTPTVEIEFTREYESRATYLRYELTNVLLTGYEILGRAGEGPPRVAFANNFEEIKVTYTEYDDEGNSQGNIEYEYKIEAGD
jgi:type VI secretion system secreted protein Hcp